MEYDRDSQRDMVMVMVMVPLFAIASGVLSCLVSRICSTSMYINPSAVSSLEPYTEAWKRTKKEPFRCKMFPLPFFAWTKNCQRSTGCAWTIIKNQISAHICTEDFQVQRLRVISVAVHGAGIAVHHHQHHHQPHPRVPRS